ncbi:hypothetical protein AGMMS50212_13640 [Spirochaetia bacterium]|nr:hypothetical protein AGMMS50212_13640 [Spirochaetia bacterium]
MGPFKPSIHRRVFIDRKIREGSFPTAVTLASDYAKENRKKVNRRTIAADIASMKEELGAPIAYDYQNRGYFYTDSGFQLSILPQKDFGNILLSNIAPEAFPKTAFLPEWQRDLLSNIVSKTLPVRTPEEKDSLSGKVSVLQDENRDSPAVNAVLLNALKDSRFLDIRYASRNTPSVSLVFLPLHLICTVVSELRHPHLLLGVIRSGHKERYALLYADNITEAVQRDEQIAPPTFVYVQTTNNNDIEAVLSAESSDILLVFSMKDTPTKKIPHPEYTLLAQTEIFL